jgi:hypothetical protein
LFSAGEQRLAVLDRQERSLLTQKIHPADRAALFAKFFARTNPSGQLTATAATRKEALGNRPLATDYWPA